MRLHKLNRLCCVAMLVTSILPLTGLGAPRTQGRSMVVTPYGMVASEHPLASQAGAEVLARGGSAADAAVAANAAMAVVSPMMCGIGGDLFALVYDAKSGAVHGLNASGWAPAGLTANLLAEKGYKTMPQKGIFSVTVPGAVEGWEKLLARFGRKTFAEVLAPAIDYAERGFPVSELDAEYWAAGETALKATRSAAATYLPGGRAPKLGEMFRNPDLAGSYRSIARLGRDAFYAGPIGEKLAAYSATLGGPMTLEDLGQFHAEWVEPISTGYRGWTVYEIPPNGQGIAALAMLNLMENFPLGEYGHNSAKALHVMIEAKKLAYADMLKHVADPKFSKIPVEGILSKKHAAARAKLIDMGRANGSVEASPTFEVGTDTTYLCVVDRDGNMVSFIQSNYNSFGSGLVAPGTGFALQNRGGLFSLEPGHPNFLAGRKRPLHTIIPGFMAKGEIKVAFGIMGGWNQSQAHAQFVSDVADHGMNIQAALEAPRFTKMTFAGFDVQMESRIAPSVREELAALGHKITATEMYSQAVGGGQAILRNEATGVHFGASDPRKDGAAIPEPYPKK